MNSQVRPRTFWVGLVVVAGLMVSASCAPDRPSAVMEPYLRIQSALAGDEIDGVSTAAAALGQEATRLGKAAENVRAASVKLQNTVDLKAARTSFGELSETLIAYTKATGSTMGRDVHVVFCPMAQKSWLQAGAEIRNPYYGSQMLGCGQIRK